MATQVAAARQPFAPLNGSRLQNLTSLKNRQNAMTTLTSPIKRKAQHIDSDASNDENLDPSQFLSPKRSKCPDGSSKDTSTPLKPINYFLTPAPPSPNDYSILKPVINSAPRPIRSPVSRLNTSMNIDKVSTPRSAPAGRSLTRKRVGILNRRKTNSPFTRIDPPRFSTAPSGLGFSIDAALSSTLSSSASARARQTPLQQQQQQQQQPLPAFQPQPHSVSNIQDLNLPVLHTDSVKDSWFFAIHEDTEEELATNLMEHGACTLDISSDEECAARERDLRGKENIPPMDDISQTRSPLNAVQGEASLSMKGERRERRRVCEEKIEIDRSPLGDLEREEFWEEGCDEKSVIIVHDDDVVHDEENQPQPQIEIQEDMIPEMENLPMAVPEIEIQPPYLEQEPLPQQEFSGGERENTEIRVDEDIIALMRDVSAPKDAKLLEPIENAEEGFAIWESGSVKDE